MTFEEFYARFGLESYPFNTFTTEDEERKSELFVEPIDYALIKDAFKQARTIIMSGNRGTGKTAIICDLERNAPKNSLITYIDDFSKVPNEPSITDFYKLICSNVVSCLLEESVGKLKFTKLSKPDRVFASQLVSEFTTQASINVLRKKIEEMQINVILRMVNKLSKLISFTLNYGIHAAIVLGNSILATKLGLPLVSTDEAVKILPDIKAKVDDSYTQITIDFDLIKRMCSLIRKMGYNKVVVMLDKIDEDSRFSNDSDIIANFVMPLLTDNKLLLSQDMQMAVSIWSVPFSKLTDSIRTQKYYCPNLQWQRDDLIAAFDRRVCVYSKKGNEREFRDFFHADVKDEDINMLINLANHNPRDLWHIFNNLFHIQYSKDNHALQFDSEILKAALDRFVTSFNYYEYYPRRKNARQDSMDIYKYIHHLLKLSDKDFTANALNTSAGTGSSTQNYITQMQAIGLIRRTDEKIGAGIVYRIADPKVVYAIGNGLAISRTT